MLHGPGAESEALREAQRVGRLLDQYGQKGLKTDEAREVVNLLMSCPIGTKIGVVVVGPLDEAQPKAMDVLLKIVEEHHEDIVRPILWARDLGGVVPTLVSRCLTRWAHGEEEVEVEDEVYELLEAVQSGQVQEVPELVSVFEKRVGDLLHQLLEVLSSDHTPENLRVWEALRPVARWRNPTYLELISALLEASSEA